MIFLNKKEKLVHNVIPFRVGGVYIISINQQINWQITSWVNLLCQCIELNYSIVVESQELVYGEFVYTLLMMYWIGNLGGYWTTKRLDQLYLIYNIKCEIY